LDSIDFKECICEYINKHHGRIDCIAKIETNLNLIGLVNTNENDGIEMPSEDDSDSMGGSSYYQKASNFDAKSRASS
jgi:hypothetical protein